VPLDGSASAEEARAAAAALARACGAELRLLRVVELPVHPYGLGQLAAGIDPAGEYLGGVAAGLRAQGLEVTVRTDFGAPGQVIGEHAQVEGTDLVAMATHGHTGLARAVLGSVAAGALQRANRPTLLVRPEAIRAAAPPAEPAEDARLPGSVVEVALSPEELELVQRGLLRLLGEVHPAEPVAALCARLRRAPGAARPVPQPAAGRPAHESAQEPAR
jgi:nucleotide-binding universal stress UspA family protein